MAAVESSADNPIEANFRELTQKVFLAHTHHPVTERGIFSREADQLAFDISSNLDGNEAILRRLCIALYDENQHLYQATLRFLCKGGVLKPGELTRRIQVNRNGPITPQP